jgi:hypothetical protein
MTNNKQTQTPIGWELEIYNMGWKNPMKDPDWPDGVNIIGLTWVLKEDILTRPHSAQPRHAGIDSKHAKAVSSFTTSRVERLGPKHAFADEPLFVVTEAKTVYLESGHHKFEEVMKIDAVKEVACLELEYDDDERADKTCAREAFLQFSNSHAPALPHGANEALSYLATLDKGGYFKEANKIVDEDKHLKKIRALANIKLAESYSHVAPRSRGGWITQWLNGSNPQKMDSFTSDKTWAMLNDIKYFESKGSSTSVVYDAIKNRIETVAQSHTLDLVLGSVHPKMRAQVAMWEADGLEQKTILQKLATLKIEAGVYFSRDRLNAVHSLAGLNTRRQEVLDFAAKINLDTYITPLKYTKLHFMPQCLQPTVERGVITYEWNDTTKEWDKT